MSRLRAEIRRQARMARKLGIDGLMPQTLYRHLQEGKDEKDERNGDKFRQHNMQVLCGVEVSDAERGEGV